MLRRTTINLRIPPFVKGGNKSLNLMAVSLTRYPIMNFKYIIARLIRKYIPNKLFDFLLQRGIGIKPGMETSNPKEAVSQYREAW